MASQPYIGETYRVRASTPMSVTTREGYFVWHKFMAEISRMEVYDCYTDDLPLSSDFRGQGGTKNYISAQFTRLSIAGRETFQGKISYSPEYVLEGEFY
jgi:hypothetical protein